MLVRMRELVPSDFVEGIDQFGGSAEALSAAAGHAAEAFSVTQSMNTPVC